ncbi:SMR and DUF1771 domain-containing protein [Schizosaccharomyces cryophilus OY26]|uniref:SMR and DUF1771 domain-containing protein n=1 Tax=Schizosaccharomyces cryophilus (strain OY26 / ATCC MYA-4695 / CBS 11777 / NBRC 106824 / NRRL Y48691) TaxID=653667 RepID=S9VWM9_SCHCR|nr:SMR and DUF1771 domain-containing protein [Schizosaccharomyces cryophilus OY26]EPY50340.1 SMR and DUF1771 domain-containing protein [Schizosaccharomyces cryophilus OY26]
MEDYEKYRHLAGGEAEKRGHFFQMAQQAYASGQKAEAHELSQKGKECGQKMEEYNRKAAYAIYLYKNTHCQPDELDLHGLYIDEAVQAVRQRIHNCIQRGEDHLHVIVGKGNHSVGHVEKLKPAVIQMLEQNNFRYSTEVNEGRIYVSFPHGVVPHPPQPVHASPYQHHQQQQPQPQQPVAAQGVDPETEKVIEEVVTCCLPRLKTCCVIM